VTGGGEFTRDEPHTTAAVPFPLDVMYLNDEGQKGTDGDERAEGEEDELSSFCLVPKANYEGVDEGNSDRKSSSFPRVCAHTSPSSQLGTREQSLDSRVSCFLCPRAPPTSLRAGSPRRAEASYSERGTRDHASLRLPTIPASSFEDSDEGLAAAVDCGVSDRPSAPRPWRRPGRSRAGARRTHTSFSAVSLSPLK